MRKTPLSGALQFLWNKFQQFQKIDGFNREAVASRSEEHVYWEEAWSFLYNMESLLFLCSSASGRPDNEPFCGKKCQWPGCKEPANSLRNQRRIGKDEWEWLPDAPRFHCHPHHMEAHYGEKYVPPTLEETRRSMAFSAAMHRIYEERPPKPTTLDCGLQVDSFTMMDGSYLRRLAEIAEEEYQKICKAN